MNTIRLREFTPARVALGRTGGSLPTRELLDFQLAHARARDAVHAPFDSGLLALELRQRGYRVLVARSAAPDRTAYLRRPDLGRTLHPESRALLAGQPGNHDLLFVAADGLSALAVHNHAPALLDALSEADVRAPVVVVEQGRVAIGDDIGQIMRASMVAVLIGERPGLSSPDSLGVYLTWNPRPGVTDADRNCISNIRTEGLSYRAAARKLQFLITESRRRKLSGVQLKEEAGLLDG